MRLLLAILLLLIVAPASAQQSQGMSQAVVVSSCGGGALASGALNQLTMDPQGRLCQSGIGSNVCSQSAAYLARTVGGNEGGNAVAITALICGLVSDGVIDGTLAGTTTCGTHLDALYILAQQNAADAILNLCGTSYPLSPVTATFTAYQGYSTFAGGGADTHFNVGTAPSPHFTLNSAMYGAWAYNAVDSNAQIGTTASGIGALYLFAGTGGNFVCSVNDNTNSSVAAPGTTGLFVCNRTSSSNIDLYWNGVKKASVGTASIGLQSVTMRVGAVSDCCSSAKTISEAHFGASDNATLELALYNRLRTYLTAVGVP